jgi:hypothetical protein
MDSSFGLFINSELFFAHLFEASHEYWLCVFGIIAFIFVKIVVMIKYFASGQESGIVIMILLLFALTAVMKFIFAGLGCTSDKVLARIFVLVPPIAMGCWACLLVVILLSAFRGRMLEDVSLDGGSVIMTLLFAQTAVMTVFSIASRGCTCNEESTRIFVIDTWIALSCWEGILVRACVFALTDVVLADVTSGQKSGIMIVML